MNCILEFLFFSFSLSVGWIWLLFFLLGLGFFNDSWMIHVSAFVFWHFDHLTFFILPFYLSFVFLLFSLCVYFFSS